MMLNVACAKEGKEPGSLRVRNLSETGVGGVLTGNTVFAVGDRVALTFKNFSSIPARVAWVEGEKIGVAFDQAVEIERIKSARDWKGPSFDISKHHIVSDKCWRPGWRS